MDYEEEIAGSGLKIEMKAIKGGSFYLGSPEPEPGRKNDEGPVREIRMSDFWMSSFEITWDLYQLYLYRETDRQKSPDKGHVMIDIDGISGATMPYVNFNKEGHPVVNVTQYAASMFCKWLTAKTGRFYRLPTEAEWEYACRAGSTTAFSFGNDPDRLKECAWFGGNSGGSFHRPGLKSPNQWGLYDMHGNVAEWVIDGYAENAYASFVGSTDPVVFAEDLYPRVVRGGSFMDPAGKLRSAARDHSKESWKRRDPQFPKSLWWHTDATHVGFRIVRPRTVPEREEMEKYWGQPLEEY